MSDDRRDGEAWPPTRPAGGVDLDAREAAILGRPPRIGPLQPGEFSDEALALTGKLRQIGSGRPPPTSMTEVPEIVATMLRHPELYERYIEFGIQIGPRGALPFRDRELVILRIGWLCRAPYEWGEHVKKGKEAGLSAVEIERVTLGATAPGWSRHDEALMRAVDELYTDAMISDETWAILAETYGDKQLIELPMLIGHYQGIAFSQNSLRLRLNAGNEGLRTR